MKGPVPGFVEKRRGHSTHSRPKVLGPSLAPCPAFWAPQRASVCRARVLNQAPTANCRAASQVETLRAAYDGRDRLPAAQLLHRRRAATLVILHSTCPAPA